MEKRIVAPLYHHMSTDDHPHHDNCPQGKNHGISFQATKANQETPGKHLVFLHTPLDCSLLFEHLEPTYAHISDINLLRREIGGTQNANESLYNSI